MIFNIEFLSKLNVIESPVIFSKYLLFLRMYEIIISVISTTLMGRRFNQNLPSILYRNSLCRLFPTPEYVQNTWIALINLVSALAGGGIERFFFDVLSTVLFNRFSSRLMTLFIDIFLWVAQRGYRVVAASSLQDGFGVRIGQKTATFSQTSRDSDRLIPTTNVFNSSAINEFKIPCRLRRHKATRGSR